MVSFPLPFLPFLVPPFANQLAHSFSSSTLPGTVIKLPQKRFYRQRAHANPLADHELD